MIFNKLEIKIIQLFIFNGFLLRLSLGSDCSCLNITEHELQTGYTNPNPLSLLHNGDVKSFNMLNTIKINQVNNGNLNKNYLDAELVYDNNVDDKKGTLRIFTTEAFKNYSREQTSDKIIMNIELACVPPSRNITFKFFQPFNTENEYDPELSENAYKFSVPLPLVEGLDLTIFQEISARDYDLHGNEVTFSSPDTDVFEIGTKTLCDQNKYYAVLKLKKPLTSIKEDIKFTIVATDKGIPPRSSSALVTISANQINSIPSQPYFIKPLYEGYLDNNLKLTIEDVLLSKETYSSDITYLKSEGDHELFNLNIENNIVKVSLAKELTEDDVKDKIFLKFILTASTPKLTAVGRTVILVNIPKKSNDVPSKTLPKFEKVSFNLESNFKGLFGQLQAVIAESSSASIHYSLKSEYEEINSHVEIDGNNGKLSIKKPLEEGNYKFNIEAENVLTAEVVKMEINLLIDKNDVKPNEVTVENTLVIKHLKEEQKHSDFLNTIIQDNCFLQIIEMEPSDKEYFKIDSQTHRISSIAIDREDKIFSKMIIPQIQVNLTLKCQQSSQYQKSITLTNTTLATLTELTEKSFQTSETTLEGRSYILTSDIPYSFNTTTLNVIIEDINDNPPEFIFPPTPLFVTGYPDAELTEIDLVDKNLIQIEATDRDVGLNAKIKYGISSNDHFNIIPETGVLYPLAHAFENISIINEVQITVFATDCDGADYGNKVSRDLIIKKLNRSHISILTMKNRKPDEFEKVLNNIMGKTKLNLRALKYGVVSIPLSNSSTIVLENNVTKDIMTQPIDNIRIILKGWIYSLDENNQQLLMSSEIKKKILDVSEEFELLVVTYDEAIKNINPDLPQSQSPGEENSVAYIIVIIVLSILLIAIISFLIWVFCLRRKLKNSKKVLSRVSDTSTTLTSVPNASSNAFSNTKQILLINSDDNLKFSNGNVLKTSENYRNITTLDNDVEIGRCENLNNLEQIPATVSEVSSIATPPSPPVVILNKNPSNTEGSSSNVNLKQTSVQEQNPDQKQNSVKFRPKASLSIVGTTTQESSDSFMEQLQVELNKRRLKQEISNSKNNDNLENEKSIQNKSEDNKSEEKDTMKTIEEFCEIIDNIDGKYREHESNNDDNDNIQSVRL